MKEIIVWRWNNFEFLVNKPVPVRLLTAVSDNMFQKTKTPIINGVFTKHDWNNRIMPFYLFSENLGFFR